MRVHTITTENFQGIPDGTYRLGLVTRVTGKNGAGKSSLGRALVYALTGLRTDCSAAADHYRADKNLPMSVTVDIEGSIVCRKRSKTGSGALTVDSMPQTDAHLEEQWGCSMEAFACLLWPGAFFHLTPAKRRELFLSITPKADLGALLERRLQASGHEGKLPDIDWQAGAKKLHADWSAHRLALEKEGASVGGQIRELQVQLQAQTKAAGDPQATQAELESAQAEWDEISAVIDELVSRTNAWDRYTEEHRRWTREMETASGACRILPSAGKCPTCGQPWEGQTEMKAPALPPEPQKPQVLKPDPNDLPNWRNRKPEAFARLNAARAAHELATRMKDLTDNGQARLESLEATRQKLAEKYRQAKRIEEALHPKTGIWAEALQEQVGRLSLPGYRFVFERDGKELFEVEQESNGTPVDLCSSGERIKFCMGLSGLIADLCDTPVRLLFLEQYDLVDRAPRIPGFQLVAERVGRDVGLTVEVVQP